MRALFEAHHRAVYGWALRILDDPADARDAVQNVFLQAHRHRRRFRGHAQPRTWLYRITVNHCLNELRRHRTRTAHLSAYAEIARERRPESDAEAMFDGATVHALMAEVRDPRTALAAYLVYCEGMSHREASEVMEVPERTVGALKLRFVAWARQRLEAPSAARALQEQES